MNPRLDSHHIFYLLTHFDLMLFLIILKQLMTFIKCITSERGESP